MQMPAAGAATLSAATLFPGTVVHRKDRLAPDDSGSPENPSNREISGINQKTTDFRFGPWSSTSRANALPVLLHLCIRHGGNDVPSTRQISDSLA